MNERVYLFCIPSTSYGKEVISRLSFSHEARKKHNSSKFIGKTLASYSHPSTIDGYWFIVSPSTLLNTFDFVTVNNQHESKTIGLVQDIRALPSITFQDSQLYSELSDNNLQKNDSFVEKEWLPTGKHGAIAPSVAVIGNSGIKSQSGKLKIINHGECLSFVSVRVHARLYFIVSKMIKNNGIIHFAAWGSWGKVFFFGR